MVPDYVFILPQTIQLFSKAKHKWVKLCCLEKLFKLLYVIVVFPTIQKLKLWKICVGFNQNGWTTSMEWHSLCSCLCVLGYEWLKHYELVISVNLSWFTQHLREKRHFSLFLCRLHYLVVATQLFLWNT